MPEFQKVDYMMFFSRVLENMGFVRDSKTDAIIYENDFIFIHILLK